MPVVGGRLVSQTQVFIGPLVHTARDLVVSAVSPGGHGEARYSLDLRPPFPDMTQIKQFSRVDLADGGGLYWRGRLVHKGGTLTAQSGVVNMAAIGYSSALGDRAYDTVKTFAAGTALEDAIKTARNDLAPDISTSNEFIDATGRALSGQVGPYTGKYAFDVLNDMIKLGDSENRQLLWHVWEGDEEGQPVLELRARSVTPTLFVSLANGATIDYEESVEGGYGNRMLVLWGAAGTPEARDSVSRQRLATTSGFSGRRDRVVPANGLATVEDARKVGDALLAKFDRPVVSATAIKIPASTPITTATGAVVSPWRVRQIAGQVIKVVDFQMGSAEPTDNEYHVARAEWNERQQMTTIVPHGQEDLVQMLARHERGVNGGGGL